MYSLLKKQGKLSQVVSGHYEEYERNFLGFKTNHRYLSDQQYCEEMVNIWLSEHEEEYGSPFARSVWFDEMHYLTPSDWVVNHDDIDLFEDERTAYNYLRFNLFNIEKNNDFIYSFSDVVEKVNHKLKRILTTEEEKDLINIIYSVMTHSKYWEHNNKNELVQSKVKLYTVNKVKYYTTYSYDVFQNRLTEKIAKTVFNEEKRNYFLYDEILQMRTDRNYVCCGIYKITNMKNNKNYIGQAVNIYKRWNEHINTSKTGTTKLYKDIRKYGIENFAFAILEECPPTILDMKEVDYISEYNSFKDGYNSNNGPIVKANAIREYLKTVA